MSYLLWHRDRKVGFAGSRVVLRAAEVPLLADAHLLRDRLEQLGDEEARRIAAAAEDARVKGYVQGREEGALEAREELAATLTEFAGRGEAERMRVRDEIATLALQVVRKLLGQLPAEGVLAALAETAAREMLPTQTLTLIVHPDQCDAVRARLAASAAAPADAPTPRFDVQPDPDCRPGVCRIETEHGTVDASLEAQLARLAKAWGVNP
ncbi:MAG TPA: FliH/SctL family protein [Burkholderiaceae bacterium]|nr:FliH/SctL family protein [Burkholderiaceae bacterium]